MCEPASARCWLAAAGPRWWWRLISQYTVERCHAGTKASGGKCRGLLRACGALALLAGSFPLPLCMLLSLTFLSPLLSSRLLCYTPLPPPRGPLGATLGSVCCWFFGAESSWRRQNKSDLKERGREQRAAAAAGVESGFYRHKSLLWWGILSNGNFFLTGGVIAFSLWTPLDIYAPSPTNAFL